jgi:hypothetical protein
MSHWYDIPDPTNPELDRLADHFGIARKHVDACRAEIPRASVEQTHHYLFFSLKLASPHEPAPPALSVICSNDWLITVHDERSNATGALVKAVREQHGSGCREVLDAILVGVAESFAQARSAFEQRPDTRTHFTATKLLLRELQSALRDAQIRELRPIANRVSAEVDAFDVLDVQFEREWRDYLVNTHNRTQKLVVGFGSATLALLAIAVAALIWFRL